jgi:anti-sigma factor RsiW
MFHAEPIPILFVPSQRPYNPALRNLTPTEALRIMPSANNRSAAFEQLALPLSSPPTARIYSMGPGSIRPAAWAALVAVILLAISPLGRRQLHQTNTLAAELLDQHLATLSSAATPQVISTDRHTVKPWFQGRLPFSFNLADATALPRRHHPQRRGPHLPSGLSITVSERSY